MTLVVIPAADDIMTLHNNLTNVDTPAHLRIYYNLTHYEDNNAYIVYLLDLYYNRVSIDYKCTQTTPLNNSGTR